MQRRDLLLDSNYVNEECDKISKTKKGQIVTHIDKEFFPLVEGKKALFKILIIKVLDVKTGVASMNLKNNEGCVVEGKRNKKHFNKNKREKLRRIFVSTSYV
jgi:hypothetical protein